jgi:hypothetical protein
VASGISIGKGKAIRKSTTGLALLVEFDEDGSDDLWVPFSQIHDNSEVYKVGHTGDVVVTQWWADTKGLSDVGKGRRR